MRLASFDPQVNSQRANETMASSSEILRLLHQGDWACAYGEHERLCRTCDALAQVVPRASGMFTRVARSARQDLRQGCRLWAVAAASLRRPRPRQRYR